MLFRVKIQVSSMPGVKAWIKISTLTFSINGFVRAKNVDLEAVMVGPAFGVPEFAVALFLDVTAQQEVAVDLVADLTRQDALGVVRGLDERRVALAQGSFLFGGAATLSLLATSHCW